MDALARGRRLLLSLALAVAGASGAAACQRPPEAAGVSNATRPPTRATPDGGPRVVKSLAILPPDFRTRYTKLTRTRVPSPGHASGRFDIETYANDAARDAYGKHTGTFPVGSILVQEHWEHTSAGAESEPPGPIMAMEKMATGFDTEHGDWRYVVVAPEGDILTDGKPDGCVLCHDDAPHDRVFRVP
jgi:hypothetical protein